MDALNKKVSPADLNIDLDRPTKEVFKWVFACLLFGKPIQRGVAARNYRVLKPLGARWATLVRLLGDYVGFNFSTHTKLKRVVKKPRKRYGGRIPRLIQRASDDRSLSRSIQEFCGVGPVTARIFVDGLRRRGRRDRLLDEWELTTNALDLRNRGGMMDCIFA